MSGEGPRLLRPAESGNPVDVLWLALPAEWRGPVIGPGIADWEKFSEGRSRRLDLTGLAARLARGRLGAVFRFAWLALLARWSGGSWWTLDEWNPRCAPRIPLPGREPLANYGCSPSRISQPWLREAVKWHLGTMLESGALRWSTVGHERMPSLARFSRHLAACFDDPRAILGDLSAAAGHAAAFARWP